MWFIGLIVGLVVGAAIEDFEGAFYGAALGALAGYALRLALGRSPEERLRALEQEVAELRRALHGTDPASCYATAGDIGGIHSRNRPQSHFRSSRSHRTRRPARRRRSGSSPSPNSGSRRSAKPASISTASL